MLRLVLKNLWAYRTRLFTSALSVVLGVSFLAGSFIFTDTLKGLFQDLFKSSVAGVDATVRLKQGFGDQTTDGPYNQSAAAIPVSVVDDIAKMDGVAAAAPSISGYAQVLNEKGKLVKTGGAPTFGFVWVNDPVLSPYKILNGRAPTGPNEVVLDRGLINTTKYKVGNDVKVNTIKGVKSFKLVGDATFGSSDSALGATTVFFSSETAQELLYRKGFTQSIIVRAKPGVTETQLVDSLRNGLKRVAFDGSNQVELLTGKALEKETLGFVNQVFGFINTFFSAFALIALFVSTFVISNSFSIIVAQRQRETGMVRMLGASRSQVLLSTVAEALVVGLVASMVGIVVGLAFAKMISLGLNALGGGLPSSGLVLKPKTVVVGMLVGTLVTLLSSILPSIRSSRIKPMAALRDFSIDRADTSKVRLILGLILALGGAGTLILGLRGQGSSGATWVGVAAGTALLSIVFLGPVIAKPVASALGREWFGWVVVLAGGLAIAGGLYCGLRGFRSVRKLDATAIGASLFVAVVVASLVFVVLVAKGAIGDRKITKASEKSLKASLPGIVGFAVVIGAFFVSPWFACAATLLVAGPYLAKTGPVARTTAGQIARENSIRNPTRTSATALALTIGTALVAGILVFSQSLTQTFRGAIDSAIRSDYVVASASEIGFPVAVQDAVRKVPGVVATTSLRRDRFRFGFPPRPRAVGAINTDGASLIALGKIEGSIGDLKQPDTIAVGAKTAKEQKLKIGDTISPTFLNGKKANFKIVALYENVEGLANLYYIVDSNTLNLYAPKGTEDILYVKTNGKNTKRIEKAVDEALKDYPAAEFQTKKKFADAQVGQFQQFLNIVFALLCLAIIIAILGIANTLRLSIFERTREIGLLRAVGMSRDQIRAAIRWEAIVVATVGALIGVVIGTGFGSALVYVLGKDGVLKLNVPWAFLVPLALMASLVGLYAARKPAKDAAKLNILRAIATD